MAQDNQKARIARNTIISKNALYVLAQGQKESAVQIFDYSQIKEIRLNIENFEVKVKLYTDDTYFRVFFIPVEVRKPDKADEQKQFVTKFYNDLITASMRLNEEEMKTMQESLKKQREQIQKLNEEQKKLEESKASEDN